jgi:hypothetical protein
MLFKYETFHLLFVTLKITNKSFLCFILSCLWNVCLGGCKYLLVSFGELFSFSSRDFNSNCNFPKRIFFNVEWHSNLHFKSDLSKWVTLKYLIEKKWIVRLNIKDIERRRESGFERNLAKDQYMKNL